VTPPALVALAVVAACATRPPGVTRRPFEVVIDGRWAGAGICYGPHRDGQRPGGAAPSDAELREDLGLLAPRFRLVRIYGTDEPAERLLALVRAERWPVRVLLGAWLAPADEAANRREIDGAIRLANAYPDVVAAVIAGNETQVTWSDHRLPLAALIGYVRQVRAGTTVPVSTADDFAFWLGPDAPRLASELDFLVLHAYAMWNGRDLADALAFTRTTYASVAARFPGVPVVLGEAGWATRRHTEGDQGKLVKGEASEAAQRRFFEAFTAWTRGARITSTYFEAFDERWKGGPHPDEIEKHWGLFRADRTPKPAVAP
jgi:exo-beta-1,3-glucanase (GH17 family)